MKMLRASMVLAMAAASLPAAAEVLTFEGLAGSLGFFRGPYQGFNFGDNDPQTNPWFYTNQSSEYYKPRSGTKYVSTDYRLYPDQRSLAPTQPITRSTGFVFDGAWFTGAELIQYKLYSRGTLVHTSEVSGELGAVPLYVASGYGGQVDSVVVLGTQGYYAMDDFTFNSAPVPEAGSAALLAGGLAVLGGLAGWRRRARQA